MQKSDQAWNALPGRKNGKFAKGARATVRHRFRLCCMYFVLVVAWFFKELPRPMALAIGRTIGIIIYIFAVPFRKTAIRQIQVTFPDKSASEIRRIARAAFVNAFRWAMEYTVYERFPRRFSRSFIESRDTEAKINSILAQGRGAILVAPHLGPWEILVAYLSRAFGTYINVQALRVPGLDDYVNRWRRKMGGNILYNTEKDKIYSVLENKGSVIILSDIEFRRFSGIFTEFLGRKAYVTIGASVLALRFDCPVIPIYITPHRDGYKVHTREAIEPVRTGDRVAEVEILTKKWLAVLESIIREHPEIWVWFGDHWKPPRQRDREKFSEVS